MKKTKKIEIDRLKKIVNAFNEKSDITLRQARIALNVVFERIFIETESYDGFTLLSEGAKDDSRVKFF